MSGAGMWERVTSATSFLEALSDATAIRHEIGRAADSRLAQPERVIWVPVPRTRRQRECTSNHYYAAGLTVFYEVSNQYDVHLRGIDVAACEELERVLFKSLIDIGAWASAIEVEGGGSVESGDNTAAEQGAAIIWPIRLWTPLVHESMLPATINTFAIGVDAIDADDTITGTVP